MTRQERIDLDKALLEAAVHIVATHSTTVEDIHIALQIKVPARFLPDWEPTDEEARYVALEDWVAGREYSDTIKHRNIWNEGWYASRDHFKAAKEAAPRPDYNAINASLAEEPRTQPQLPC